MPKSHKNSENKKAIVHSDEGCWISRKKTKQHEKIGTERDTNVCKTYLSMWTLLLSLPPQFQRQTPPVDKWRTELKKRKEVHALEQIHTTQRKIRKSEQRNQH